MNTILKKLTYFEVWNSKTWTTPTYCETKNAQNAKMQHSTSAGSDKQWEGKQVQNAEGILADRKYFPLLLAKMNTKQVTRLHWKECEFSHSKGIQSTL